VDADPDRGLLPTAGREFIAMVSGSERGYRRVRFDEPATKFFSILAKFSQPLEGSFFDRESLYQIDKKVSVI
jgi:hypothetical protein